MVDVTSILIGVVATASIIAYSGFWYLLGDRAVEEVDMAEVRGYFESAAAGHSRPAVFSLSTAERRIYGPRPH
jgi:hypothetical protein